MGRSIRVAVGQCDGALAPEARLDWLDGVLPEVAADGVDLLVLPELFACGYHVGDLIETRAEAADGPVAQSVARLAQKYGVAVHYGFAERDGDRVFNSAQCIGPDGLLLGGHRKLGIPPGFEKDFFTAGQGCALFEYRGVKIATLICYDAEFTEPARHVAGLGAELVVVPTALGAQWGWVARTMIPTRAYENGVFLAYANSAGEENGLEFLGESLIAAPDGEELARAGDGPEVITATLEIDRVAAAQARLPYLRDRGELRLT